MRLKIVGLFISFSLFSTFTYSSEYYWHNGTGPGSEYYWHNGTDVGSEYYWNTGTGAGSEHYWKTGTGNSLINDTELPLAIQMILLLHS